MSRNCHRSRCNYSSREPGCPCGHCQPFVASLGKVGSAGTALGPSQAAPVLSSAAFGVTMGWAGRDLRAECDFSSQFLMLMLPFETIGPKMIFQSPALPPSLLASFGSGGNVQGCALPEMFHSGPFPLPQYRIIPKQLSPCSLEWLLLSFLFSLSWEAFTCFFCDFQGL